jgi:ketosteroid isomerase-like protein
MATAERSDTETTKQVLERFYAAIGAWDEPELKRVVADDAELHQPPTLPYGKIYRGRDELMRLWQEVILPLADPASVFVDNMIFDGEYGVAIAGGKMAGKDTLACEEYHVRDGQIVRIRMFWFDPTPVAEAFRAMQASKAGS